MLTEMVAISNGMVNRRGIVVEIEWSLACCTAIEGY